MNLLMPYVGDLILKIPGKLNSFGSLFDQLSRGWILGHSGSLVCGTSQHKYTLISGVSEHIQNLSDLKLQRRIVITNSKGGSDKVSGHAGAIVHSVNN